MKERIKFCPVCGLPMELVFNKKATRRVRNIKRYKCSDRFCTHIELSESTTDSLIRRGIYDDEF